MGKRNEKSGVEKTPKVKPSVDVFIPDPNLSEEENYANLIQELEVTRNLFPRRGSLSETTLAMARKAISSKQFSKKHIAAKLGVSTFTLSNNLNKESK